jgi:hypothetical protein
MCFLVITCYYLTLLVFQYLVDICIILMYIKVKEKEEVLKMIKVLSEQANIKVDGKWLVLKAVLVAKPGGKTVCYIDTEGNEVFKPTLV